MRPTLHDPGTFRPHAEIERAVLESLAYSDIFSYPLRPRELHRYLPLRLSPGRLDEALKMPSSRIGWRDGYCFLPGRGANVDLRKSRAAASSGAFGRAVRYGRTIAGLPFVRMVGLTGSLAVLNCETGADFDYFLIAAPGRLWTARGLVLLFGRLVGFRGDRLCPNLIISEDHLDFFGHDLYSARELCQMIPLAGFEVYRRLRAANSWTDEFLPNAAGAPGWPADLRPHPVPAVWTEHRIGSGATRATTDSAPRRLTLQSTGERLLLSPIGGRLEAWEMHRKISRLARQPGFGDETVFSADVCQGNFNHHRARTQAVLAARLDSLGLAASTSRAGALPPRSEAGLSAVQLPTRVGS